MAQAIFDRADKVKDNKSHAQEDAIYTAESKDQLWISGPIPLPINKVAYLSTEYARPV